MSLVTLSRTPPVSDKQLYRLLVTATFPFFLMAAAVQRRRMAASGAARRSVLAEARATSASALHFAFQG